MEAQANAATLEYGTDIARDTYLDDTPGQEPGEHKKKHATVLGHSVPAAVDGIPGKGGEMAKPNPERLAGLGKKESYQGNPYLQIAKQDIINEFQVTEDNNYNVGFSSLAILATSPASISGVPVSEANGENITNNMHHHKRIINGTYVVGEGDIGDRYVNIVGYAYSNNALPGHTLTINQDYGRLSVLRFSP